jgi:hypothetical protein
MKITYSVQPSAKGVTFAIFDVAEVKKHSSVADDAQYVIVDGVLYPVRPEVQ